MEVVLVGTGRHAAAPLQRRIGHDAHAFDTDRAERAGMGTEERDDLVVVRRAQGHRTQMIGELLLLERMVTAEQHEYRIVVGHVDQGLDLTIGGGTTVEGGEFLDGANTRCGELLG